MNQNLGPSQALSTLLFYRLSITPTPNDITGANVKKRIDLRQILDEGRVLFDDDIHAYFIKNDRLSVADCDLDFVQMCYTNYDDDGYNVDVVFLNILDFERITMDVLNENRILLTAIHMTFKIVNNTTHELIHCFNAELDNLIRKISEPKFFNLSEILIDGSENTLSQILTVPLFDFQTDNLNWVLETEANPIGDYFSNNRVVTFPDGRMYNYTENCIVEKETRTMIYSKGGIIGDETNMGKTLQAYCIALLKPDTTTLILVPNYLYEHWVSQWDKHFLIPMPDFITLIKFSDYRNYKNKNYTRLIVDEIHELYQNDTYKNIFNSLLKTPFKYKWGLTKIPFPTSNSLARILEFLTEHDMPNEAMVRCLFYFPTYERMIRRNIKANNIMEIPT